MKKIVLLLFVFSNFIGVSRAQLVPIPDGDFQTYLRNTYPACFTLVSGQWNMDTTCTAIVNEDSISLPLFNDIDLDGLQYFDNLKFFKLPGGILSAFSHLIRLPSALEYFWLDGVSTSNGLPILNNGLRTLASVRGDLRILPSPLPDSLRNLAVQYNQINFIPPLPPLLERFLCSGQRGVSPATNVLTSLPALPSTLKALYCNDNALSALPPLPDGLVYLDCSNQNRNINPQDRELTLGALPDLPPSLDTLFCSVNKLTSLPDLPAGLKVLWANRQRHFEDFLIVGGSSNLIHPGLSQIPTLPAGLEFLNLSYNNLEVLPPLPGSIINLDISNNVFTHGQNPPSVGISSLGIPLNDGFKYLDVSNTLIDCIPHIPASMQAVLTAGSRITCLPNSGSYTATPARPLCSPTNNANQCPAFPVIAGELFYDHNSNGVQEPNENGRANVEVQAASGLSAYSNINGYFEITGDTGTNVITVLAPTPYVSVPATATYIFNTYDTLVNSVFALQPTVLLDSLKVSIINDGTPRPGFDFGYTINYENVGTTVLSSTIQISYDATNLTYVDATIPGVTSGGGVLTVPAINSSPGDRGGFSVGFTVNTTAPLGDTLLAALSATVNAGVTTDSIFNVITGSYDPNDKNATPELSPAQVIDGTFINYLVRFQNTGTDTAFNVVVTDTLDARLDAPSFQMLETSHPAIIKRNGSALTFEFLNIQLPDSNVNEPLSHGYIKFRVKPVATLVDGDLVNNRANIYFDYNAPVVTNTAVTNIVSPQACFTITAATTSAICAQTNGGITVTVSGGSSPYSYSLNNGTPQASADFTALAAGTYSVKVVDGSGCADSISVIVASTGGITATAASIPASCPGANNGAITVTPNGGTAPFSYSLDGGTPQASGTFTGVAGGNHTVVVTDASGCTGSVDVTVAAGPGLTSTATSTPTSCAGVDNGTITVTPSSGTSPFSYSLDGGTSQTNGTFSGIAAGPHTVMVTDANGCTGAVSVTIASGSGLSATATSTASGCGQQNGSIMVTVNGGAAPYSYALNNGVPQPAANFTNVSPGTHILSVTDASGCTASLTAVVDETPITATLTTTNSTCSAGGTIEITGSNGTAPFMYSINGGAMQSAAIFNNLVAGNYVVLVQDANMCTYTEAVTITVTPGTVIPSVSITASATSVCVSDNVIFTATATNGGANPQYQWLVNGANAGTNASTLTINPAVNSDVSVILTSNDPCASPATATSNLVTVTVNAVQTPSITISGTTTVTLGSSTTITSSILNGGTPTYQWQDSTSSHTWANIAGATAASIDYTPQQTGDGLRAILTSTASCTSSSTVISNALYFTVETSTAPRMRLYPNPVRSILTIENNGQTQWVSADILDDNGRKVSTFRNGNAGSEVSMDVSMLMSGIYFIRLIDRHGKPEYFKFIKQ